MYWIAPPELVTLYTLKYKSSVDTKWTSITNITTTNRSLSSSDGTMLIAGENNFYIGTISIVIA